MAGTTAAAARPSTDAPTAGYQTWNRLSFLHWRVSADAIQETLPDGLEVECFDDSAWLGLVPFSMEDVRPWWFISVPGISNFLETNLRTYVRHSSGLTGVWFYSLDASARIAVWAAQTFWKLPYFYSRMSMSSSDGSQAYLSERISEPQVISDVEVAIDNQQPEKVAPAGSLEEFLLERYVLFTADRGQYRAGRVHHDPYQFRPAEVIRCRQALSHAVSPDLNLTTKPDHAVFSSGVQVRVTALQPVS